MADCSIRFKLFVVEGLGLVLALFGAFVLVGVLFPLINPGQFEAEHRAGASIPLGLYLIGSFFAVGFMGSGYALTRWARRIRAAAEPPSPPPLPIDAEKPNKSTLRTIHHREVISFVFALIGVVVILGPLFFYSLNLGIEHQIGSGATAHPITMVILYNGLFGILLSLAALGFTESATALRKRQPENSPLRRTWWKSGYKLLLVLLILFSLLVG